jgi:methylmalonyl-CoA mutase N-terminal domain/subunit
MPATLAGSTAVQEVAFTLADGIAYVEAALRAGLRADSFGRQLAFFFNAHNSLLEEVAKFRAARRLWARIMRERFGATDPRAWMLRFHAQTAGSTLTAQQPENNVVRVAIQALAAVLGGAQSLHTNSRDEALGLPTEEAVRIALRTQQVLAHESGVADVADALGGSYCIEALTDRIEAEARAYIEKIDRMGGMLRAIEIGYVQQEIQEAAYQAQRALEEKRQIVVGVNEFMGEGAAGVPVFAVDARVAEEQCQRLEAVRESRDAQRLRAALQALGDVAAGSGNLLPAILESVRASATIGEICNALRAVFGVHQEAVVL